jgi:hypothetical protein
VRRTVRCRPANLEGQTVVEDPGNGPAKDTNSDDILGIAIPNKNLSHRHSNFCGVPVELPYKGVGRGLIRAFEEEAF